MTNAASCTVEQLHQQGQARGLARAARRCGDCGVARGGLHHPGCDLQRCPCCTGQFISCGCRFDEDGFSDDPDDDDVDEMDDFAPGADGSGR